jgi:hypothetical protein
MMTIPFDDNKDAFELWPASAPALRKPSWREQWPVATIALGAVFTLIWLAALILLFALRI